MVYVPQQAPSNLDTDGLRRFLEEQTREIARAWNELVTLNAQTLTAAQATQVRTNIGSFGVVKIRQFTASGTYTPSVGLLYAIIECVGSGGGGGGVTGSLGYAICASGAGSGSYSRTVASAAIIGASQVVTVNNAGVGGAAGNNAGTNGGTVSVGSLCIANGGIGSSFAFVSASSNAAPGGAAGTGDLAIPGNPGSPGMYITATSISVIGYSGAGGNSYYGAGGTSLATGSGAGGGGNASGFGSGGGGASSANTTSTAGGGNGAKGVVVITEFTA
jgi:hypothetical protein